MSASNSDDDTLISQDDIDKLLSSSSLDEAEAAIGSSDDELGELSQDDIDSLLNNVSLDVDDSGDDVAPGESSGDDLELVSQDDIDRLMGGVPDDEPDSAEADEPDGDDLELVSQDDIDRLMGGVPDDEPDSAEADEPDGDDLELVSQDDIDRLMGGVPDDEPDSAEADEPDGDDLELVSQDDIDRLMNGALDDEPEPVKADEPEEDDQELVSQDDIDRLMNGALDDEPEPVKADAPEAGDQELVSQDVDAPVSTVTDTPEFLIDESEAVDVEKCLVTQETIDRLLAEASAPAPAPAPEPEPELELEPEPESETELEIDLEELLGPDPVPPAAVTEDQEVTQDDIDDLLQGDELGYGTEDSDLISQDDIDELLLDSEEEDEDILGNLDGDPPADLDFTTDSDTLDLEEHQVILEEAEEALADLAQLEPDLDETVPVGKWYRSQKVLACCAAIFILAVTLPVGYFTFFTTKEPALVPMAPVADLSPLQEPQVATVEIDLTAPSKSVGPGNLVMKDFFLLVPGKKSGLSYVTASVSIDYSDHRALTAINRHLPLYRDLIFDAMGSALGSEKVDKVTEADLLGDIKEALNRVLPGQYVDRVTFTAFSTG
jgi:pilus assembly protein FimV